MTKSYICDNCGKQAMYEAPVQLNGVAGASGILLPESCMHKDFCDSKCFWMWAEGQFVQLKNIGRVKSCTGA